MQRGPKCENVQSPRTPWQRDVCHRSALWCGLRAIPASIGRLEIRHDNETVVQLESLRDGEKFNQIIHASRSNACCLAAKAPETSPPGMALPHSRCHRKWIFAICWPPSFQSCQPGLVLHCQSDPGAIATSACYIRLKWGSEGELSHASVLGTGLAPDTRSAALSIFPLEERSCLCVICL